MNWPVEYAKMLSEGLNEEEISPADILDALASSGLKLSPDLTGESTIAYQDFIGGLA